MPRRTLLPLLALSLSWGLAGCTQSYSPNTYAAAAAQQAAKVERGVIVGTRPVMISPSGAVGAVTGGAAGGVAGSQAPGGPLASAFGAIGGTLVGGLVGSATAQTAGDTPGFEYIVQEKGGHLVSVAQTDRTALPLGLHVLVIAGKQARIVPDYTVEPAKPAKPAPDLAAAPIIVTQLPQPVLAVPAATAPSAPAP